jgi:2-methylisocitrate lyase-like PEP mutase family enzyme
MRKVMASVYTTTIFALRRDLHTMPSQSDKAHAFRALHTQTFLLPNPWDAGSARILEGLGFAALATTSAGFANSRGQLDGDPGRDALLAHAAVLVNATQLPVSADLENGFGDEPDVVAETIRRAAAAGLVGGSIEDYTGRPDQPLYEIPQAAERIRAAAEAARSLGFPFTLTARAENYFRGKPDLADTIRRLQAYQEAGADVLFAPSLRSREDLATVLREIDRPLNVLAGLGGLASLSLDDYRELGVRRLSVGSLLSSVAYGALIHAAQELKNQGTFGFVSEVARAKELRNLLRR